MYNLSRKNRINELILTSSKLIYSLLRQAENKSYIKDNFDNYKEELSFCIYFYNYFLASTLVFKVH